MIDILFVHPNASSKIYQDLSKDHAAIEPPLWANMLTHACRNKGFSADLLDCEVNHYDNKTAIAEIKEWFKPRLICFVVYGQQPSASTQNMEGAVSLAEDIKKELDIPIIFVGGHIAAVHEEVLDRHECVDYICQNEGVYTILELIECYKSSWRFDNSTPSFNDLHNIKGLGFRPDIDSIRILLNAPSPIVPQEKLEEDLPSLGDFRIQLDSYRTSGWHAFTNDGKKSPFAAIYTSLGCPFGCSFCSINSINRTTLGPYSTQDSAIFRHWKPEFIIKQFDYFAERGVRNIKIADELFILRPSHFLTLCNLIIERGYDFNIWCYGRVDSCKKQYLDTLKKAGVNFIGLGIESINKTVRQDVTKGGFSDVKIDQVIKDIENAGINVGANYIFGLPEDTNQSMQETLDFAIDKNTAMANMYCAVGYPGSQLYLDAKQQGTKLPDTYSGYSQHSYDFQPLPSKHLSAEEILRFRDNAWMKYHTNPQYFQNIQEKFGKKAYNSIVDATKIKLKRKILGD